MRYWPCWIKFLVSGLQQVAVTAVNGQARCHQ